MEHAVVLAPERSIEPEHLPFISRSRSVGRSLPTKRLLGAKDRLVREFERQAVLRFCASGATSRRRQSRRERLAGNFHRRKYRVDPARFSL